MRADGKAIVIITHKLHEVMALSDRVAVLRKGEGSSLSVYRLFQSFLVLL